MFWAGHFLTVPMVYIAYNSLLQRRDSTYNWQTIFMTCGLGMGALAAEMIYLATNQKIQEAALEEKQNNKAMDAVLKNLDRGSMILSAAEDGFLGIVNKVPLLRMHISMAS